MKVTFVVKLICDGQEVATMWKDYEFPFMPQVGMKFNCGELGEEPEITDVILRVDTPEPIIDAPEPTVDALITREFTESSDAEHSLAALEGSGWRKR